MEPIGQLGWIQIDCRDPRRLARFCGAAHVQGGEAARGDFWSGDIAGYALKRMFAMMKPVVEVCRGDSSWPSLCIRSVLSPTYL